MSVLAPGDLFVKNCLVYLYIGKVNVFVVHALLYVIIKYSTVVTYLGIIVTTAGPNYFG